MALDNLVRKDASLPLRFSRDEDHAFAPSHAAELVV